MEHQITDGDAVTNEGLGGFGRRAFLRGQGRGPESIRRRPVIGICSSWSELNPCNVALTDLSEAVKRGIVAAGGQAYVFPTISLGEQFVFPTSMILRNLMAMDVEEMIRRSPIDAVVLLAGCDKTVPAQLMGAASAGRPAIMLTAGPRTTTRFRGRPLLTDDIWELAGQRDAGLVTDEEWTYLEGALCASAGVCNVLGTATTMAMLAETLGMALPGSALIGATDARRAALAETVGQRAVTMARDGQPPADILTVGTFENALRLLVAVGGSTNAVIHLEAIAGRVGLRLGLERLARISAETPLLASVRPTGRYLLEDLDDIGGVPAVLNQLRPLLDLQTTTALGASLGDTLSALTIREGPCLRPINDPYQDTGGVGVVWGNLAPRGAIIKVAGARSDLRTHEGPALLFEGAVEAASRPLDPAFSCPKDAVLVVRGAGPLAGMPELGQIPIPNSLRRQGITEMVCVTDARISGTQKGATALHVGPESAIGGPLAAIKDGDLIRLDAAAGTLDVILSDGEIAARLESRPPAPQQPARGYSRLYFDHVLQADEGCDFDFLLERRQERAS